MKLHAFKSFIEPERKRGATNFTVIYCDNEILLRWINTEGFICGTLLHHSKRMRPSAKERAIYQKYRKWLSATKDKKTAPQGGFFAFRSAVFCFFHFIFTPIRTVTRERGFIA
ncbi:hypothetical protein [Klebsiella sp. S69]|uniref:hypothetical protein n=1 Tax=Klebsiella sp. S69 TaxID=2767439 RepID=UPI001906DBF8|nr:hypothetical protein [Klebsiella sp. S69]MBK0167443.1 hypothetical protein [Klebsiella sp. S69]